MVEGKVTKSGYDGVASSQFSITGLLSTMCTKSAPSLQAVTDLVVVSFVAVLIGDFFSVMERQRRVYETRGDSVRRLVLSLTKEDDIVLYSFSGVASSG